MGDRQSGTCTIKSLLYKIYDLAHPLKEDVTYPTKQELNKRQTKAQNNSNVGTYKTL